MEIVPESPVFGLSEPTPLGLSFDIDTTAAPVVFIPAGTGPDPFTFATDLYGFHIAAISNFSVSFGTSNWAIDDAQLVTQPWPDPGNPGFPSAYAWFDRALADGATPYIDMQFENTDGTLALTETLCAPEGCYLEGVGGFIHDRNSNSFAAITYGTRAQITLIPEPSTGLLVIAGLLGLPGWRRVSA
jgi:hypothetical protein